MPIAGTTRFQLAGHARLTAGPTDELRAARPSNLMNHLNDKDVKGIRIMMPYDTYRLYQIERAKSPAEVRHADQQAARFGFASAGA